MAHFIMIHGAWSVGQMWDRVVPLLEVGGHVAEAPTLLDAGSNNTMSLANPIGGWADQIADRVRAAKESVVLVAQSRGGLVISEVAERIPERIGYLVYAAAFLLPNGASLMSVLQSEWPDAPPPFTVDDAGMTTVLPEALNKIYSKTPLRWVEMARANQRKDPLAASITPLALSDARFGSVPRAYIEATGDEVMPLSFQRSMQAKLPCDPVFSVDADHVIPTSAPEQLAEHLIQIARRVDH